LKRWIEPSELIGILPDGEERVITKQEALNVFIEFFLNGGIPEQFGIFNALGWPNNTMIYLPELTQRIN